MDKLIEGIAWLASEGRNGAKQLSEYYKQNPDEEAKLEEAGAWIEDLLNGIPL